MGAQESHDELAARVIELEEELDHERRTTSALKDVGIALGTTLNLDELLELILHKITDLLDADRTALFLLDEAKGALVSRLRTGETTRTLRSTADRGIAGTVARTGKTIRVRDAYRDDRFRPEIDELPGYRTKSVLAAPLRNHVGKVLGVVLVLNKKGGRGFTEMDEGLLAALATQAAVSIDNSRLFLSVVQKNRLLLDTKEQLEHRVRDLKLLFELESAMGRAASERDLLRGALREAALACDARAGGVLLGNDSGENGDLYVWESEHPHRLRHERGVAAVGAIGRAMRENEPVRLDGNDVLARSMPLEMTGFSLASAIAVPLEGENQTPLGALALYDKRDTEAFSDEDVSLLRLIAANVSTAVRLSRSRIAREHEERLSTIGRLLSGVVHDLKTPMAVISGYVQMMATTATEQERAQYARLVVAQLGLLAAMQREVLEFARGERKILLRKVYLGKFFGDLVGQLERGLDSKRIKLVLDLADKGTARFDETKLTRAVHNLVRNAIEAMGDRDGTITIAVRRDPSPTAPVRPSRGRRAAPKKSAPPDVVVSVHDTGPGIPKEIETRLFESFVSSGKKGGTGLGLAIVKKIAEEHGGHVAVESSSSGTTFSLSLPQRQEGP